MMRMKYQVEMMMMKMMRMSSHQLMKRCSKKQTL